MFSFENIYVFILIVANHKLCGQQISEMRYFGKLHDIYPELGELVEITFLSNSDIYELQHGVKHSYQQSYHILELKYQRKFFHLHMAANHIDQTASDDASELEAEDGHYYGTISGKDSNSKGSAALTLNQNGFFGYIILDDEHFAIEPDVSQIPVNEDIRITPMYINRHREKRNILHRMYRSVELLQNRTTRVDEINVPEDAFDRAVREMNNNTMPGNDSGDNSTIDAADQLNDLSDSISGLETGPHTLKGKVNTKAKSSGTGNVLEIAVFTDAPLYKLWLAQFPKNTKKKIKSYVLNIIQNMNLLYGHKSLGLDLSIRLVYLEIQTSEPSDLPSNIQGSDYLDTICKYAAPKNDKGHNWDHAALLTGLDIMSGGDGLLGIAYYGTMCLKDYSCSLTETLNFESSVVLTHEVGHSLGMKHDGIEPATTCDDRKYIMSPKSYPGQTIWSTCSAKQISDFINKGSAFVEKQDPSKIPKCLKKNSPLMSKQVPFNKKTLPGETYDLKKQCFMKCGKDCIPYTAKAPYDDVCYQLYCEIISTGKLRSAHPALEGTVCATGKHCRGGKCVSSKGKSKSG